MDQVAGGGGEMRVGGVESKDQSVFLTWMLKCDSDVSRVQTLCLMIALFKNEEGPGALLNPYVMVCVTLVFLLSSITQGSFLGLTLFNVFHSKLKNREETLALPMSIIPVT